MNQSTLGNEQDLAYVPHLQHCFCIGLNLQFKRHYCYNVTKRIVLQLSPSTSLESSANGLTPLRTASAFLHRRPSEKRFCLATTNGQLAVSLNKPKSKATNEEANVLVAETQNDLFPAGKVW